MEFISKNKHYSSNKMLKKLRIQFVFVAMTALIIMQSFIICISMNYMYSKMIKKTNQLVESVYNSVIYNNEDNVDINAKYFYVIVDKDGDIVAVNNTYNRSIRPKKAVKYYQEAVKLGNNEGFYNGYRYKLYGEKDRTIAIFLLRTSMVDDIKKTAQSLIVISVFALSVMFVILIFISKRMVRPIARSYKKQKEFITSASHELKTPLTVILADLDILQMDDENNEWIQDIRLQAERLTEMTNSLVSLARMDEKGEHINRIDFSISDVAEDVVHSYKAMAVNQEKTFLYTITPQITCFGDENSIRQLFTILLDNAFKYCSDKGEIQFSLTQTGNIVTISVKNNVEYIDEEQLDKIFDRFYRADATSAKVSGYGLGLSIASAIVSNHKGRICAKADKDNAIIFNVSIHTK